MVDNISRRKFVSGTCSIVAAPLVLKSDLSVAADTKLKFCLPWIPHGGYAFLFAANKLGYWKNRGLDVQIDRGFGSGETCKRVALGQYDYGLADFATMVKLADDGLPLTYIGMVSHVSQLGILSSQGKQHQQPEGSRRQDDGHHGRQRRLRLVAGLRRRDRHQRRQGQGQHRRPGTAIAHAD